MSEQTRLKARQLLSAGTFSAMLILLFQLLLSVLFNFLPLVWDALLSDAQLFDLLAKTALSAVFAVLFLVSWLLFRYGADFYFFKKASDEKSRLALFFEFWKPKHFYPALRLGISLFFVKLLYFCIFMFPCALFFLLTWYAVKNGCFTVTAMILLLGSVLMLVCSLWFYFGTMRLFFMCKYLFFKNPNLKTKQYLEQSVRLMKNQTRKLFCMRLSFFGWFLLCLFVVPIPYVWCYYKQAMAVRANGIIEMQNFS